MMESKRPSKRPPGWKVAVASLALLPVGAACGPGERTDPCPLDMPTPPFRLTVDTAEAALNTELQIQIAYGGNQMETYQPGQTSSSEDICCATLGEGSTIPERIPCSGGVSDASTGPTIVVCDLWTGGAANLTIQSGTEVVAEQTLQAAPRIDIPESCGLFETLEVHWTYGAADAGVAVHD